MKRIYISMPITGYDIKERVERSELLRRFICALHPEAERVFTPFDICPAYVELPRHEDYLNEQLPVLRTCDLVYVDMGWQASKGCNIEIEEAKKCDIEVREFRDKITIENK